MLDDSNGSKGGRPKQSNTTAKTQDGNKDLVTGLRLLAPAMNWDTNGCLLAILSLNPNDKQK